MKPRLRDLGIQLGRMPTGAQNAITDVPGVLVGHTTLIADQPRMARTGVTVVVPSEHIWHEPLFAGSFSFNGNGEMTGLCWIDEAGQLDAPIGITNTNDVGTVRDAIVDDAVNRRGFDDWLLPVAAETWDGWLSDINAFHVTREHVFAALDSANSGPVAEGNVGGGTGMICHEFKGGIGTASRIVATASGTFTVGVLVQANYGLRELLTVGGAPIGRLIGAETIPTVRTPIPSSSSIIVIVATDAPCLPTQCQRLAKRATVGLAKVGGFGSNSSGDIFLAFSTGNRLSRRHTGLFQVETVPHQQMTPLFEATAEATEEAILNALCAAETTTGFQGHTVYALPTDDVARIWRRMHDSFRHT